MGTVDDSDKSGIETERTALALLGFITALAFALLLRRIWLPADALLDGPLVDDVFYYLQVAWNYSEFGSMSLDGRNETNGFHPLYMWLLLALKPLAGDDKLRFLQLALTLLAVAHVATGALLSRAYGSLFPGRPMAALIPACVWLFWPTNGDYALMGMESSLLGASLALTFYAYTRLNGTLSRDAVLGLALSVAAFARTDALLLIPIVNLWIAFPLWRATPTQRKSIPRRMACVNAVVLLSVGGYLASNVANYGSAMPMSGRVKIARTLGFETASELNTLERIQRVASINMFEKNSPQDQRFKNRTIVLSGLFAFELLASILRRRRESKPWMRNFQSFAFPSFMPWLVYAIGVHVYYLGVQGYFSSSWYLLHSSVVVSVYAAHWLSLLTSRVPERAVAFAVAGTVIFLAANQLQVTPHPSSSIRPSRFTYDFAMWTNKNLPPETRIGAFNAGTLAYFSHCSITNLDGLINNAAGEAILHHRLGEYVENEKIGFLADFGGSIRWSNVYAQDNYVKRLYTAVANFGNPTTWEDGDDYMLLRLTDPGNIPRSDNSTTTLASQPEQDV